MRNTFFSFVLVLAAVMLGNEVQAQELKFGHFNSKELLQQLPEMEAAISKLETINTNHNEQLTKMQNELRAKSESFAAEQASLPEVVLAQRQQELQQMDQNVRNFYQAAQQEIKQKELELTAPIIEKTEKAIKEIGDEEGFTYIFDVANGSVLYKSLQSIDISLLIKKKLGLITQ